MQAFKLTGKRTKVDVTNLEWKVLGLLDFNITFPIVTEYQDYLLENAVPKTNLMAKKSSKVSNYFIVVYWHGRIQSL